MQTLRRLSMLVVTAALAVGCGDDDSGSTGTTAGSATATSTASASGSTATTDLDTDTGSTSDTGTASGSGSTTGAALPPTCTKTADCASGRFCLNKPCDVVMDEPGCGELRCYSTCSEFIGDSAQWICADDQACCGGYPCDGGYCTESFETG